MAAPDDSVPGPRLRVMQIIAGALIAGVLIFLGIVLFLVAEQTNGRGLAPPQGLPVVSLVAVLLLAVNVPLAVILPGVQARAQLERIAAGTWTPPAGGSTEFTTEAHQLLAVRQTTLLVGLALVEGVGFLGCIAYLMEAQPFVLGVVAVALVVMAALFPTEGRVRAWLERQQQRLAELRQLGS